MTQEMPDYLDDHAAHALGRNRSQSSCLATMISPGCTFFTKSLSISSMQCSASSAWSLAMSRYLAGNDYVCIYIVSVFKYFSVCLHHSSSSYNPSSAGAANLAGYGAGCGYCRACQIYFRIHMSHTAYKVPVRGGYAALACCQDTHMAAQAGAAGRGADDGTRLDEDLYRAPHRMASR